MSPAGVSVDLREKGEETESGKYACFSEDWLHSCPDPQPLFFSLSEMGFLG